MESLSFIEISEKFKVMENRIKNLETTIQLLIDANKIQSEVNHAIKDAIEDLLKANQTNE